MSFKVGDNVKRIRDNFGNAVVGEIYVIREISPNGIIVYLEGDSSWAYDSGYFELAEKSKLERLVDTANEGVRALRKLLSEHRQELEVLTDDKWTPIREQKGKLSEILDSRPEDPWYRVKQKPKFEPFEIGNTCWKVELKDGRLHVGCQEFDAKEAHDILTALCFSEPGFNHQSFQTNRKGISYHGSNISWEDADKILKALREAGY